MAPSFGHKCATWSEIEMLLVVECSDYTRLVEGVPAMGSFGWMNSAACVGLDPALFEPAVTKGHNTVIAAAAAEACAGCPVAMECELDTLVAHAPGIVRAGQVANSRQSRGVVSVARDIEGTWAEPFGHGSHESYSRGCTCQPCKDAHARQKSPNGSVAVKHGSRPALDRMAVAS